MPSLADFGLLCPHCTEKGLFHDRVTETDTTNYDHTVTTWVDYFRCGVCDGLSQRKTSITSLIPTPHLRRDSPVV